MCSEGASLVSELYLDSKTPLATKKVAAASSGASSSADNRTAVAAEPAPDAVKVPMQKSTSDFDSLRISSHNMLHMAHQISRNDPLRSLWWLCSEVIEPVVNECDNSITDLKTRMGTEAWLHKMYGLSTNMEIKLKRHQHIGDIRVLVS